MKKFLRAIILLAICCSVIIIPGCKPNPKPGFEPVSGSGTDSDSSAVSELKTGFDFAPVSEIRESFSQDVETIKSKEYDNLNFDKAVFSQPPKIDSICELELETLHGKSTDEIYAFLSETIDRMSDNAYTEEEKRYKIRFADGPADESKSGPYKFLNIDDYKNGNESEYPRPYLNDGEYYFSIVPGVIRGFDNGDLAEFDGAAPVELNSYHMISSENHKNILYTEDLTSTDTYNLIDGEISIADAAKFAQKYLDELAYTPYTEANMFKPTIFAVNVFDIGKGCYGFSFLTRGEYNGVFCDHHEQTQGGMGMVGVATDYDERRYNSWIGRVEMIRTDKMHRFVDIARGYEVVEGEPTSEIITIGSAADIVSEFYSGIMNFTVTEVSMVWVQTDNQNWEVKEYAYPCWKFKMYADGEIYHTFVNVITGEIYLYVQVV